LNHVSQTSYDGLGNVVLTTDPLSHTTQFGYDNVNRQTSVTTALSLVSSTSYDVAGRVVSATDARNLQTQLTYDALGRTVKVLENAVALNVTNDAPNPDRNVQTDYAYDFSGNLLTMPLRGATGSRPVVTYGYDALNRRTSVDGPITNDTWTTTYDKGGRTATST